MANNKPIDTIRDGQLKAAIWKRNSDKGAFYSVELSRSYKAEDGTWRDNASFVGDELLRIARLAGKAYDRTLDLRATDRRDEVPNDGRFS